MNAPFRGTEYLETAVFMSRLEALLPGQSLVYATGDLAFSAQRDGNLVHLRGVVWSLYQKQQIALTQRPRTDQRLRGGRIFDYIATKRTETVKESK
jgi:hypothetical protein